MAEYIEREASCKDCFHFEVCDILDPLHGGISCNKFAPAADVVEVVRCKDCEYCRFTIDPKTNIGFQKCGYIGYNPVQSSQVSDNDFCSHGERRKEDG